MTPSPVPDVDRVAASRRAVEARRARALLKSRLAIGAARPIDVLRASADPQCAAAASLRVTQFLRAVPQIGEKKTERILDALKISPAKRLGGLGARQRERLSDYLERRAGAEPARVVVLAGPTAVGKGTVARYIRDHFPTVHISVSATTRSPRPGERDGVDYYFVDDAEFDRMIAAGELLEYATVHNAYRYGTPASPIRKVLAEHRPVLLEIDLQGARQVRAAMPDARLVFLQPPSWEELVRRLVGRGTESPEEQARRLDTARVELASQGEFDARVVNDSVPEAARKVIRLMGFDPDRMAEAGPRPPAPTGTQG